MKISKREKKKRGGRRRSAGGARVEGTRDEGRGSRRRGLAVGVWFGVWGWREMDLVCGVDSIRYRGRVARMDEERRGFVWATAWTWAWVWAWVWEWAIAGPLSLTAEQYSSQTDRQTDRQGWRKQ